MRLSAFILILFSINVFSSAKQKQDKLYMVFFTPADIKPPAGHKQKLKEIADYAEDFFAKWMKHWGYKCHTPLNIARDKKGFPEILYFKGKGDKNSGEYSVKYAQQTIVPAL
ncbi:MAG: hypothetical protein HRT88_24185, partial [Lentisphaeraceae bacterium]|nr:hypothetical protein [Lentisphaeraceae bacterium]